MGPIVKVKDRIVGGEHPIFFVAEIGVNHNGDLKNAKKLIDIAKECNCDAVKFQKRDPEEALPPEYKNIKRESPWGIITYLEYRKKIEFWKNEYDEINKYCKEKNILWSASCWDIASLEFILSYDIPFLKVPSALITHKRYLERVKVIKDEKNIPIFVSTGMADMKLVKKIINFLGENNLIIMHTVSTYPAKSEDIRLNVIKTFINQFRCPIGYSGHEVGLQITLAAAAIGAKVIERHITLDRSMWGTDQAASIEPQGLRRLIRDIRIIEKALGSGDKKVIEGEYAVMDRLRKVRDF